MSEREREREREAGREGNKENGCKRFGSWYFARRVSENPSSDHFEGTSSFATGVTPKMLFSK